MNAPSNTIKIGNGTLMAHAGGEFVTPDFLSSLITPAPEGRHYPTPFHQFYMATHQSLEEYGFTVGEAAHCLSHENQRYFGLMSASIPQRYTSGDTYDSPEMGSHILLDRLVNYEAPGGDLQFWRARSTVDNEERSLAVPVWQKDNPVFEHVVGLRSSWDQTFSNQLVMGTRTFVCDNLAFSGQIMIRRKNTLRAVQELPGMVNKAIERIEALQVNEEMRVEAYTSASVSMEAAKAALVDVIRDRGIGGGKMLKVLSEIEEPTHEEHLNAQGQRTVWTVKNAFTEVFKEYNLASLPARSASVNKVLDRVAGFVPATAAVIDID